MPVTCDLRLRLARAVAREEMGFALGADNRAGRRAPLAELVAAGEAFAVVPDRRLFAVDADPSGLVEERAAALRVAFDGLVAAARAAGVPVVVAASGRPGHRHAFLVVDGANDADRAALTAACRRAGLDVRDAGIRPPLSPHRGGLPVGLLAPADPAAAAATLEGAGPPAGALAGVAAALGARRLSLRIRRLLRDGHGPVGLPSASEGRMAVAVAVRGAGLPLSYLAALLDDPAHALAASYRARPARWRRRELDRLWAKAGQWLLEHPLPVDDVDTRRRAVATWRAALGGVAWPGVGGASALAVAEALGALAGRLGRLRIGTSLDEVALAAGLSRDAARSALRRLTGGGWLRVDAEATPTQARVYVLALPAALPAAQVADAADGADAALLEDSFADLGADVARWSAGIGKSSARVARELAGGPATVGRLAERLHMSANAVRIHLRRLARLGVAAAEASDGGHRRWRRTGLDAAALADRLGVAGARREQAAAVAARRAQRSAQRSEWRSAVGRARRALREADQGGWAAAGRVLPARVLSEHLQWAARRGPLPAWAAPPAS